MLAMDGTSESFDFSFLSSEDVLFYREIQLLIFFPRYISSIEMESGEKHSEGRGESARMRVSGSVERLSSYVT